ncbi:MAG: flagellar hook-associated protein 3 [Treponema sp. CETP13]|nr:MAG: flagellar hook-associated protein 3 [Treponema sp. CETP13]
MRVSSNLLNNDVQSNLRIQESRKNKVNNQIGSQQRIQQLRDDPLGAGHLVRYNSYLNRVNQFEKNAKTISDQYSVTEGYLNQSVDILQRLRELAVTGANGIYTKEDTQKMAAETNELLKELISTANAVGPDGTSLFAGTRTTSTAYDVEMGNVEGSEESLITNIRYNGSIDESKIEVDNQSYMSINRAGNSIFWSEQQKLFSQRDVSAYQAKEDSVIGIDGKTINIATGDNVYSIIAKINNSGAAVKASIDPVTNGLNLETTDARQLWLEDKNGTTLQDLGIIKDKSQQPPYNIATSATVSGGSLFESVIALRDSLLTGDAETVGGKVLGSIDSGLDNLLQRLSETGAQYERAQQNIARAETNQINVTNMISREGDLDITEAITDMKMLEYVNQATLSTAGKLYDTTLLNYMR